MSRRTLIGIALTFLALNVLLAGVLITALARERASSKRDALAERAGVTTDMNAEQIAERYALLPADAIRFVHIAGEMSASGGRVKLMLENDELSLSSLKLTLILTRTGEVVLATDLVSPGHYIEYMTAEHLPEAGDYACVARFQFFDSATGIYLGDAGRHVLLKVSDEREETQ